MIDNFIGEEPCQYEPFNRVFSHASGHSIFLGDASAANDLEFIKEQGIGLVITAATNMEQLKYEAPIQHVVYSLLDSKTQNVVVHFGHFHDLIEQHIDATSILVHCFAGISRSATLVISYLMKKCKLTFKQAIAEVRKYRPTVLPNLGFQRQLKQYEKALQISQLSLTRKMISKTSQSKKHQPKKLNEIALPEIFALGKTLGRPKLPEQVPHPQPSSQMESRKVRLANLDEFGLGLNARNHLQHQFKQYEPLTNRVPLKRFRKRSISISRKLPKDMGGSEPHVQLVRLPPYKLAINEIRFETEKVMRSAVLKQFYH